MAWMITCSFSGTCVLAESSLFEGLSQSCEFEFYLVNIHIMIADSLLNDFSKEERKRKNLVQN